MEKDIKKPLADRMRPQDLEDFVGQEHIVGEGKMLRKIIESDAIPSMIFWGPPGSGKTTLAEIIAKTTDSEFVHLSAVSSGVKEVKKVVEKAQTNLEFKKKKTILFLDEIHRFNKAQQDRLLPYVEDGTLILIGATTENPSFEVNSALISRSRVFVLEALRAEDIKHLLERALSDKEKGFGKMEIKITPEDVEFLAELSNGDARTALNVLELSVMSEGKAKEIKIDKEKIKEAFQRTNLLYDKGGEQHYNIISALHKSMRGGDADAALYWMARMLEGGEDPLYVARRLIRFASEDIGIANSFALDQAVSAYQACHFIGMPECAVNLAQAVVYMAKSKKSNALYKAYYKVKQDVENFPNEPVPIHLRNAPTKLMKELGYGQDYKYTPDFENPEDAVQQFMPDRIKGHKYLRD
ncbi:MAG: Recombination protein MgsA [Candidatus Moranbacteria bacterium GW2011_GWE1_49_15]|nr:MAG: Recombination protein MgsA [Candidatus Moranbacteria bacterium GW2011_GWE2_47_10]KKW05477.1 MAG: Recombination protein MgsA [Candidatus Moranbacteria bacterium GW2011_GWE1_49_15]